MKSRPYRASVALTLLLLAGCAASAAASDWPQYLRDAQHTGDAHEDRLELPLVLKKQVELDDAVLTSPAVVAGRVYVVDQMGTAYGIHAESGTVLWKTAPEEADALGSNTSSPCVVAGRIYFGTIAGKLHVLDARTGSLLRSLEQGSPIVAAITSANDSVYFQTLDGVVHCLDLEGQPRWRYDHYGVRSDSSKSINSSHYSGNLVAVSGRRIVTAIGWDVVCLEDQPQQAKLLWKRPPPLGDAHTVLDVSISGGFVYAACPGKDGLGAVIRLALEGGSCDKRHDVLNDQWAVLAAPAVRGMTAYFARQAFGVSACRFGSGTNELLWSSFGTTSEKLTPALAAPALSRDHCVFTTLHGELIVVPLQSRGHGLDAMTPMPLRFRTPQGRVISSAPAIADGQVFFGSDDGFLYVLGSGKGIEPMEIQRTLHQPRSQLVKAGQRTYDWPSAFGGPGNANFVDDSELRPPFRLRWATPSGGLFKHPVCAVGNDVVYVTLGGLVACREQMTGRLRWRRKLDGEVWTRSSLLCAEGNIYVPRMFSTRYPKIQGDFNKLFCLDGETGEILWQQPLGIGDRLRASPVYADGVVAYGSYYPPSKGDTDNKSHGHAVDAWDAKTGEHLWQVRLRSRGLLLNGPAGCVGDDLMIFAGGGEGSRGTGETVAIVPRTGKVLWRTNQAFASQTGTPSYQDGKVFLSGAYQLPMTCLSASDGKIIWQHEEARAHWYVDNVSLGPDYFTVNNKYKGGALRWNLSDGTQAGSAEGIQLWGPAHGCGSVVLTSSGGALSATKQGLYLTDVQTGGILWKSPGFASYTCPHPSVANGRIFYAPQVSGLLYCFEPTEAE